MFSSPIILASKSPRRIDLMQQTGLPFTAQLAGEVDECYSSDLQRQEIPLFLARLKADAFLHAVSIPDDTIVVTADTVVWIDRQVLGKPSGREDAIRMLETLSGNMHQVYTGVCLTSTRKQHCFFAETKVFFRPLSHKEIVYYVDRYQPYDKAGAYGIQEWIGCVGIERIEGSYSNVVGLPTQMLYRALCEFVNVGM